MTPSRNISDQISAGVSVQDLLDAGVSIDDIAAAMRTRQEQKNKEAQATLPYTGAQADADWAARKAWLFDGQAIHGDSKGLPDFFWPAYKAGMADDQAEFSRYRDLIFKALLTMLGPPPVDPPEEVTVSVDASAAAVVHDPGPVTDPLALHSGKPTP